MNVSDVRTRLKRTFGDESGVQVTDDDITRWINDGQRQIVASNENLLEKTALTSTVADQQEYTLPADILVLRLVKYKSSGSTAYFRLQPYTFSEFNEYVDGWDADTSTKGEPIMFTTHMDKLIIYPVPDTAITDSLKIYYNRKPTDVDDATDTIDLPVLYHETLVKYCLTQAYEMDEDWEAAGIKANEMTSDLGILRDREDWKLREFYPTITVLAEDL